MTPQQKLARTVRRYREKSGIGVRELARAIGVDPSWVVHVESGRVKQPPFERLQLLADALGAPADQLFADAGYEPQALPELRPYLRVKYGFR